jgi:hypothetical protein
MFSYIILPFRSRIIDIYNFIYSFGYGCIALVILSLSPVTNILGEMTYGSDCFSGYPSKANYLTLEFRIKKYESRAALKPRTSRG